MGSDLHVIFPGGGRVWLEVPPLVDRGVYVALLYGIVLPGALTREMGVWVGVFAEACWVCG